MFVGSSDWGKKNSIWIHQTSQALCLNKKTARTVNVQACIQDGEIQDGTEHGSRVASSEKNCSFSYVLFVILLFYVLDVVSITVYDRHTLLNIGSFVAQRKPDFEFLNAGALFTDTASEPFVWAARPRLRKRRRKRGKRAGVLVRFRRRPLRPPLPTILLANVQSLDNKLCELRGAHFIPTRNKGLLHYLPHRNMDVCSGSRLSHQAYGVLRAPLGQNERAHRENQRWGRLFLYQQLVVWWKESALY